MGRTLELCRAPDKIGTSSARRYKAKLRSYGMIHLLKRKTLDTLF